MSPASGPERSPQAHKGPGPGCDWAGREAGREKCWIPRRDMHPEPQVAVPVLPPGRLSPASAARKVPPNPAPHPVAAPPALNPTGAPPAGTPVRCTQPGTPGALGQGVGATGNRAGPWATTELTLVPPRTRVSSTCPNPAPPTPLPPPPLPPNARLWVPEQYSRWAAGGAHSLGV